MSAHKTELALQKPPDASPWRDAATGRPVQGTAFHFAVRFREGQRPQSKPISDPVASRPLRILSAEDNLVNQKLACRLLEKMGHQVIVAGDGTEVLQLLESAVVDVVLMDVQMPMMDGLQAPLAIRLSEREHGGHLPIVALTANALSGDRERRLAAGMDAYLARRLSVSPQQHFKNGKHQRRVQLQDAIAFGGSQSQRHHARRRRQPV